MEKTIDFRFHDTDLKIYQERYQSNNNLALTVYTEDHEPYMTISVNVGVPLEKDEFYCKNYSENTGVLDALVEQNIIKCTDDYLHFGQCKLFKCKLITV